MTHLEEELNKLNNDILELFRLVKKQMEKAQKAFLNRDTDLAEDVIHGERRINALELSIDRECEQILALFQPVAKDLRFVLSVYKMNYDLERIGDYAQGIADYVVEDPKKISPELLQEVKIKEMLEKAVSMVNDIGIAFENQDTSLARKVYQKDKEINSINKNSSKIISNHVKSNPDITREALFLFSTIRKIERIGDHVKNVAEDLIFYLEAEVVKHGG